MAERGAIGAGELEGLLEGLRSLSGEVTTAAVLSGTGDLRAATVQAGVDRERYGAMLAALAGLARRTAREGGEGAFAQARIGVEDGYVLLVGLSGGGTLAATTGPEARVGLVLYDMRNVRGELERVLGSDEPAAGKGTRMRKVFGGLLLLGAAAGAGYAVRNYLRDPASEVGGEVRITLEGGAEIEPDPGIAREFTDIARRVLEISG
ncbi:roadblock/LC7 domain-containing protein [Rubrobacter marinus]|nr:roadblock/LC7 domain-containing protein [Rubrobacter marinus]